MNIEWTFVEALKKNVMVQWKSKSVLCLRPVEDQHKVTDWCCAVSNGTAHIQYNVDPKTPHKLKCQLNYFNNI